MHHAHAWADDPAAPAFKRAHTMMMSTSSCWSGIGTGLKPPPGLLSEYLSLLAVGWLEMPHGGVCMPWWRACLRRIMQPATGTMWGRKQATYAAVPSTCRLTAQRTQHNPNQPRKLRQAATEQTQTATAAVVAEDVEYLVGGISACWSKVGSPAQLWLSIAHDCSLCLTLERLPRVALLQSTQRAHPTLTCHAR